MKILAIIAFCFSFAFPAYSADSSATSLKRNLVFVTFAGKENFGSVNFERLLFTGRHINFAVNVGTQPFQFSKKFSIPFAISFFTTGSMHHLEVQAASTFYMDKFHPYDGGYKNDYNKQLYINPLVGYRFQKSQGVVLKAGAGPRVLLDPPSNDVGNLRPKFTGPIAFVSVGLSF